LHRIGRSFAFSIAFIALFGAFGGLIWNVGHAALHVQPLSITLCELSSADDVVVSAYLEAHANQLETPAGSDDTPVTFVVRPGETASDIAERLEREGLTVTCSTMAWTPALRPASSACARP